MPGVLLRALAGRPAPFLPERNPMSYLILVTVRCYAASYLAFWAFYLQIRTAFEEF